MFYVIITNISNNKTWEGPFETYELALQWKNIQVQKTFRNVEQMWFRENKLTDEQIANALDERLIEVETDLYVKEYLMPAQATFTIEDKTQEIESKNLKDGKRFKGKVLRDLSQSILNIVTGHVLDNNLTNSQINQLKSDFNQVFRLLQENMPLTAKPLIDAIVADGTIVTQVMLDDLEMEYGEFKKKYPDIIYY